MSSSPQTDPQPAPAAGEGEAAAFIKKWADKDGGERANYQLFIGELCDLLGAPAPEPANSDDADNAYVYERRVAFPGQVAPPGSPKSVAAGQDLNPKSALPFGKLKALSPSNGQNPKFSTSGFIDCYKRGCFVFETKQGVEKKDREALSDAGREREAKRRKGHGVRGTRAWDETLVKARNQAERYIRALPATEGRPPFLIVADVGHCIELYSEFTRSGGIYTPFPDARSHRIMLSDLRSPEIRERLRLVWTDPLSLDPARRTAAVTRDVAVKLAALAKSLEKSGHKPKFAAEFLMRCIFTMFAEDVELLPKGGFGEMLKSLRKQVHVAPSMLESLWKAMDRGEFFPAMWFREKKLLRFNGGLFAEPKALAITDDQLELLIEAAKADWRDVEPAIFGTLLERALEPTERHKLGAHYTPRAYVERLVLPTVIEPLRADWQAVQAAAAQLANEDKEKKAREEIEKFHRHLCHIRVLDPACGTGNFLYVTLEHLKRLEGEVLDTLERFGGNRSLEMDTATVRPSQMRGIEINPRAAVIAELVLWIGYLQWHLRTAGDVKTVSEPILEDAKNIETRDAILTYDSKTPIRVEAASSRLNSENNRQNASSTEETYRYFNPLREVKITEANLPHWRQDGVTYFVTFRLADSLPQERLQQWQAEREEWLARNPEPHTDEQKAEYFDRFSARMEMWLDAGHGSCCLADPACREIVEGALRHFDDDRYVLGRFAVAKNHLHVLVTPKEGHDLSSIIHSWKSYTANEINKHLNRTGTVWQKEFYDHIVRSPGAAYRIENYIAKHSEVEAASSRFSAEDKQQDAASTEDKRQDAATTPKPIFLTRWDGRTTKPHAVTGRPVPDESFQLPIYSYENPRPASWPQADFIVGNPPFIGASRMRDALGDGYVEALRKTIKTVPESADYVMYWWNHAAETIRQGHARRFGFVTTNSIRQTFNRRVLEKHLAPSTTKQPSTSNQQLSLIFAIPDHPWVDDVEAAAVRVAMTVGEAGNSSGLLQTVESEDSGDESYKITFRAQVGKLATDLTIGVEISRTDRLLANGTLSSRGMTLGGVGFILEPSERMELMAQHSDAPGKIIFPFIRGRDLAQGRSETYVLDAYDFSSEQLRAVYPAAYQWLLDRVKPIRDAKAHSKDGAGYAKLWWMFAKPRQSLRAAIQGLDRMIVTPRTAKHRFFEFLPTDARVESEVIAIATNDAYYLGILSSRLHLCWALAQGGRLGVGNDPRYNNSRCFETFPFPDCTEAQKARIRELGEALDAHRKSRQAAHPGLTMTGMYNVLEKLKSVEAASSRFSPKGKRQDAASTDPLTAKEKTIHEQGLVSVLKQLHDDLDAAVLDAYWPDLSPPAVSASNRPNGLADLTDEEILTRLVALNQERAAEEKRGHIRWLRPEYQAPDATSTQTELVDTGAPSQLSTKNKEPRTVIPWPKTLPEQVRALRQVLETQPGPVDPASLAKSFKGVRKERIEILLETLQALGHAHELDEGKYSA